MKACNTPSINGELPASPKPNIDAQAFTGPAPRFIPVDVASDEQPSIDSGIIKVELSNGVSINIPSSLPKAENQKL